MVRMRDEFSALSGINSECPPNPGYLNVTPCRLVWALVFGLALIFAATPAFAGFREVIDAYRRGDMERAIALARETLVSGDLANVGEAYRWVFQKSPDVRPFPPGFGELEAELKQLILQGVEAAPNPDAQFVLSKLALANRDSERERELLKKAADAGHAEAIYYHAYLMRLPSEEFIAAIRRSAAAGFALAQYQLAQWHSQGYVGPGGKEFIRRDEEEAFKWYERVAENYTLTWFDHGRESRIMGRMRLADREYARGTPTSLKKAFELFLKSAEEEAPGAMHQVIEMYSKGIGVEKNQVEAAKWEARLQEWRRRWPRISR